MAGAEALFADMGHFNRTALQVSTMTLVYPCIMASYIGQGVACCVPSRTRACLTGGGTHVCCDAVCCGSCDDAQQLLSGSMCRFRNAMVFATEQLYCLTQDQTAITQMPPCWASHTT